jgi:hypothetical protein
MRLGSCAVYFKYVRTISIKSSAASAADFAFRGAWEGANLAPQYLHSVHLENGPGHDVIED